MNSIAQIDTAEAVTQSPSKMAPEIASAVISVMTEIKRLGKDTENKFQHYQYTSVDQFFESVGPLMAKSGIFTLVFEDIMDVSKRETTDDRGNVKSSVWLSAKYNIYLFHSSGVSYGPVQRSIQVPASGAQSYASAMSFVEKYFLRSLFKIPTGDADADGDDKGTLPPRRDNSRMPPRPPGPPKISEDQMREIGDAIRACGSGTWDLFSKAFDLDRLGDLQADKIGATRDWLAARQKAKVPPPPPAPMPPKAATTWLQAPQAATAPTPGPFDFDALRKALRAAPDEERANAVFDELVTQRSRSMSDEELRECDNIARECFRAFAPDGE